MREQLLPNYNYDGNSNANLNNQLVLYGRRMIDNESKELVSSYSEAFPNLVDENNKIIDFTKSIDKDSISKLVEKYLNESNIIKLRDESDRKAFIEAFLEENKFLNLVELLKKLDKEGETLLEEFLFNNESLLDKSSNEDSLNLLKEHSKYIDPSNSTQPSEIIESPVVISPSEASAIPVQSKPFRLLGDWGDKTSINEFFNLIFNHTLPLKLLEHIDIVASGISVFGSWRTYKHVLRVYKNTVYNSLIVPDSHPNSEAINRLDRHKFERFAGRTAPAMCIILSVIGQMSIVNITVKLSNLQSVSDVATSSFIGGSKIGLLFLTPKTLKQKLPIFVIMLVFIVLYIYFNINIFTVILPYFPYVLLIFSLLLIYYIIYNIWFLLVLQKYITSRSQGKNLDLRRDIYPDSLNRLLDAINSISSSKDISKNFIRVNYIEIFVYIAFLVILLLIYLFML